MRALTSAMYTTAAAAVTAATAAAPAAFIRVRSQGKVFSTLAPLLKYTITPTMTHRR
jgi:hypothetical protein